MSVEATDIEVRVAQHLVARGIVASTDAVEIRPLAGGVSNDVLAATAPGVDVVVKHALERLRVEEEWHADPARIEAEARALRVASEVVPGSVPTVVEASEGFLVIERAPSSWGGWKESLLGGEVDLRVARSLGALLGRWQSVTADRSDLRDAFAAREVFDALRIDPFHRTIAARHPDLSTAIEGVIDAMDADRRCVVHGDFSPKNILAGPDGDVWVIDWEVVHTGDPSFDPAWILGHLMLKSIRRPELASTYATAAEEFLRARNDNAQRIPLDHDHLVRQIACLMLARVDGKSPVDYLDAEGRDLARSIAGHLLRNPPDSLSHIWSLI